MFRLCVCVEGRYTYLHIYFLSIIYIVKCTDANEVYNLMNFNKYSVTYSSLKIGNICTPPENLGDRYTVKGVSRVEVRCEMQEDGRVSPAGRAALLSPWGGRARMQ